MNRGEKELDEVNYRFKTTVHKQVLNFANTTNQKRHFQLNLRILNSSPTDV